MSSLDNERSPSQALSHSSREAQNHNAPSPSRKRRRNEDSQPKPSSRRRMACQSCRLRKVKCDNARPACGFCSSGAINCIYLNASDEKTRQTSQTALMMQRLDQILTGVEGITSAISRPEGQETLPNIPSTHQYPDNFTPSSASQPQDGMKEISKDYLRIPACNSTADMVLTWPVFEGRFAPEHFTEVLLLGSGPRRDGDDEASSDAFVVPGGLEPLSDERIPHLIDCFLERVHTKNPILDVEALIQYGRRAAASGPGWDGPSCLVLLACALGTVALPFDVALGDPSGMGLNAPAAKSSTVYRRALQQADSCYALACRRLGLLKQTVLGAQCYFFSAVYLMYTFRTLHAWNHFRQASTLYQIHSRTISRSSDGSILNAHLSVMSMTQRRLEQSLYWSCFKSECEIRVELPLPQSTIADMEYPHMFPSPPPHPTSSDSMPSSPTDQLSFPFAPHQASTKALNEEKSWYYYLTEVALRRIGNRILNTFYAQGHTSWWAIAALIPLAEEFESQILVWSANLPPAMKYDTTISSPSPPETTSRELSWATWNRLLEMKTWLYQPFLYHAIHNSEHAGIPGLRALVDAAVECHFKTIRSRSLRHRHHGIWFDVRACVTAALSIMAAVKSGNVEVGMGWEEGIRVVLGMLAFWEGESEDIFRAREVVEKLFGETRAVFFESVRQNVKAS